MDQFTTQDAEDWIKAWPVDYVAEPTPVPTTRTMVLISLCAIVFLLGGLAWVGYELIGFVSMVSTMEAYR